MVDTHCHLNFRDKFPDVGTTISRAHENGVHRVIVVGCDTETSQIAIELAYEYEQVFACVGWHPTYAANYSQAEISKIEEMTKHTKCVAIGEIGLDYHWDFSTPEQQRICTAAHLKLAVSCGLPVVFHCREAYDDLLDWLEELPDKPRAMVLHCFSGNLEHARRGIALGCYFGVDGPVTYKNASSLRNILATIPLDRLLLETDAPYLTPHPYRGKPNEPAMIPLINAALAEVLGVSPSEMAEVTTRNAERVFGLAVR